MEIVVATNNKNKMAEIGRIMTGSGHSLLSLADVGIVVDPPETGKTFAENAYIKAATVCRAAQKPSLADDSGLCVDFLGGDPGIRSARFAGRHGDDGANNKKLLYLMERAPFAARTARFVCVVALVMPDGRYLLGEGRCEGRIGFTESGRGGFGYDPLFYIGEKSFADMTAGEKDSISHRAVALRNLMGALPGFLAGPSAEGAADAEAVPPAEAPAPPGAPGGIVIPKAIRNMPDPGQGETDAEE